MGISLAVFFFLHWHQLIRKNFIFRCTYCMYCIVFFFSELNFRVYFLHGTFQSTWHHDWKSVNFFFRPSALFKRVPPKQTVFITRINNWLTWKNLLMMRDDVYHWKSLPKNANWYFRQTSCSLLKHSNRNNFWWIHEKTMFEQILEKVSPLKACTKVLSIKWRNWFLTGCLLQVFQVLLAGLD